MPGEDRAGWSQRGTGLPEPEPDSSGGLQDSPSGCPGLSSPNLCRGAQQWGTEPSVPSSPCSGANGVPSQAGARQALLSRRGTPGKTLRAAWMGQGGEDGNGARDVAQLSAVPEPHAAQRHPAPLPLLLGPPLRRGRHSCSSRVPAQAVLPMPVRAGISLPSSLTLSILETDAC